MLRRLLTIIRIGCSVWMTRIKQCRTARGYQQSKTSHGNVLFRRLVGKTDCHTHSGRLRACQCVCENGTVPDDAVGCARRSWVQTMAFYRQRAWSLASQPHTEAAATCWSPGVAGMVAGAMAMAAGEYVSVCSQSDAEYADLELERT